MSGSVMTQMITLLEEQAALYGDLLSLATKKRDILVAGGGSEFEVILQGEQALVMKAGRLEDKRISLQSTLAAVLGVSPETLTLTRLIEAAGTLEGSEAPAARLKEVSSRIAATLEELKRTNALNMRLIRRSLAYINSMFQALGKTKKSTVYSGDGRFSPGGKRHRLDHQI